MKKQTMLTRESSMLRYLFLLTVMFLCLPIINLGQVNNSGPKLSEVTHDATLTGRGTTDSPLGVANGGIFTDKIANGAVTSSKLGTNNVPQAGQVLSFNGTGLSWQTPSAAPSTGGALRVVDSTGEQVGLLDSSSNVIRYISSSDIWLRFTIDKFGIGSRISIRPDQNGQIRGPAFDVYYEQVNCQGQPYMVVGTSLIFDAPVVGSNTYFPSGPGQPTDIKSLGSLIPQMGCLVPGTGNTFTQNDLAPMVTLPISSLGAPPFKVSQ